MRDDPTLLVLAEELLTIATKLVQHENRPDALVTRLALVYEYTHPDPDIGWRLGIMDYPDQPAWQVAGLLDGARRITWEALGEPE